MLPENDRKGAMAILGLDRLLEPLRSRRTSPTREAGVPGTPVVAGYIQEEDVEPKLRGRKKYQTYSRIMANTTIVSAGLRFFLNLAGSVEWKLEKAEGDEDGEFQKMAQKMLFEDPDTPWHRIVRRASMYRFYGFSVQEWTAKRGDDGMITIKDVAPRAQITIERWDVDHGSGEVIGIVQRDPLDGDELYIPRGKTVYLVDDTLNDSPEGLGLFRHIVKAAERLEVYERLEGQGYVNDLRGVPLGRAPLTELDELVEAGKMSAAQRQSAINSITSFVSNHARKGNTAVTLDSSVWETSDDRQAPSSNRKWDIEIMKSPNISPMGEVAQAIQRVNLEIARVLGVEGLLLGGSKQGSFALSKDKSQNFFLIIEGTLKDVREALQKDLLDTMWEMNGLPADMKPKLSHAKVQYQDAQDVAETLAAMARAGAPVIDGDPIINEVRHLLGLSDAPEGVLSPEAEGELTRLTQPGQPTPPVGPVAPEEDETDGS